MALSFSNHGKKIMEVTIILLLIVVVGGFLYFGFRANTSRSKTKDQAMKDGQQLRDEGKISPND
jgi:hypothetical protein